MGTDFLKFNGYFLFKTKDTWDVLRSIQTDGNIAALQTFLLVDVQRVFTGQLVRLQTNLSDRA